MLLYTLNIIIYCHNNTVNNYVWVLYCAWYLVPVYPGTQKILMTLRTMALFRQLAELFTCCYDECCYCALYRFFKLNAVNMSVIKLSVIMLSHLCLESLYWVLLCWESICQVPLLCVSICLASLSWVSSCSVALSAGYNQFVNVSCLLLPPGCSISLGYVGKLYFI
jgi:hypothetical protein